MSERPRNQAAALPIDPLLPAVVATLRAGRDLVVVAEPGAGKTTRLPLALLESGLSRRGIVVLEPRRIAARLAAEYVARELGEAVGGRVGYETRDLSATSSRTMLRFVTEGILTRRLLVDESLDAFDVVVFDELHERHLQSDLCLALVMMQKRTTRPDLRVVAMSATLDDSQVAAYLGAEVLSSKGRAFPVSIEHRESRDERPLSQQIAAGVAEAISAEPSGDVLVFLPSAREIRFAAEALQSLAARRDLALLTLHGSQSPREQDATLRQRPERRVILSTNVAETSVTIDGVSAVVDSGLALSASCSPWSGLPQLKLAKISKASAKQRAGRAGRTRAGRALRLFSASDHAARPEFDKPEIERVDLAEAVLVAAALGHADVLALPWLSPPPDAARMAAEKLLLRLGALSRSAEQLRISETGQRMLRFATHPRQARMIVEAERRGVVHEVCAMAALLSERGGPSDGRADATWRSDLLAWVDELDGLEASRGGRRPSDKDLSNALRTRDRLIRAASARTVMHGSPEAHEDACLISVLTGYPDRVGRVRSDLHDKREVILSGGSTIKLSDASRVRASEFICAVDVEERSEGMRQRSQVRLASEVRSDWLLELYTDEIVDEETLEIPAGQRRVQAVRTLRYDGLVLERTSAPPRDAEKAAQLLAQTLLASGLDPEQEGALQRLGRRLELLGQHMPELGCVLLSREALADRLAEAAYGLRGLDELRQVDVAALMLSSLPAATQRALAEQVPERLRLASGRSATIAYPDAQPPSVASRIQDFFGLSDGPRILGGRVALVLHLCAPNQRPVQVTTDLAGFWERHYPAIARELRRRYPRHPFPDDPRAALPPTRSR